MSGRRRYRAVLVKNINVAMICKELAEGPVFVGLDVAKEEVFATVRDCQGKFLHPWKVKQPSEIMELVKRLLYLADLRPLVVALESTGTYGDALRQAMTDAKLEVHRVSGKAKSDYEEIFDGVPSAHDGKDAAIIAELASFGKSCSWPHRETAAHIAELKSNVVWLDTQQSILQIWQGRLEALLARHWPEATKVLKLNTTTLLRLLAHYGGPAGLREDEEGAARLAKWGGSFLKEEKIQKLCASAKATVGVRMNEQDRWQMANYAVQAIQASAEVRNTKNQLKCLSQDDETTQKIAQVVGSSTACVLQATVGDPGNFHCAEAYRKMMGLNLKEHSSGKHQGRLKITKRGPSLARRWLYFAALRIVQSPEVRPWFEAKKKRDGGYGSRATIGVMRKLALAIWHVAVQDQPFELERLFPGKPLLPAPAIQKRKSQAS